MKSSISKDKERASSLPAQPLASRGFAAQPKLAAPTNPGHRIENISFVVQPKLTIGEPNDKYEQEADRVAAQVVQKINAPQDVQRQDEALQMKPILQRKGSMTSGEASTDLESAINGARSGGQALDLGLQAKMGAAMGADFSRVRVHTDSRSDQLNQSIQAKAFTTGQDLFFRKGAYDPGSRGSQELIAHELTHVVQQSGRRLQRKRGLMGGANDKYEQKADQLAAQVVQKIHMSKEVRHQDDVLQRAWVGANIPQQRRAEPMMGLGAPERAVPEAVQVNPRIIAAQDEFKKAIEDAIDHIENLLANNQAARQVGREHNRNDGNIREWRTIPPLWVALHTVSKRLFFSENVNFLSAACLYLTTPSPNLMRGIMTNYIRGRDIQNSKQINLDGKQVNRLETVFRELEQIT